MKGKEECAWNIRNLEEKIKNYEHIKGSVICCLEHPKKRSIQEKNIFSFPYLDMCIYFRILLQKGDNWISIPINKEMMKKWNVTPLQFRKDGQKNTEKILKPLFCAMEELLELPEKELPSFLYILTNQDKNMGAGVILYDNMMERIWEILGEDYYILPSSIHETILVPASKSPGHERMKEMVWEINRTKILPEEYLSDSVYFYCKEKGIMVT